MGAITSTDCPASSVGSGSYVPPGASYQPQRENRRKRVTGFATLKRKFIRRRRSSKACDHARVLRDFVSDWSPLELAALCEEYDALAALKDLSVQAELARPPATTYKQDLSNLFDSKVSTDCDLVFRGTVFPVHRSILSARCSYFRELLASCPGYGARICLELPASPIDVQMFSSLLRYLYTGDLCPHDPSIDLKFLRQLGDDFGTPNPLEHDLRFLLETGDYADATLVFTSEGGDFHRPDSGSSEYGFRQKLELPCHKAVLSARSPFFKNLIARRTRNVEVYAERTLHVPTRIVLDESVIPKRYAKVLLNAIYLDTVDLSLILRGAGSGNNAGSLGEVHALTNTGRARPTHLEEAMELFQIGRFLDLDILAQGCEDLILEWLSLETLPTVLKWGSQPHGSAWVFRQACQYLREEFSAVISSPSVLHQLDKSHLITALQSNFLQASELEVLSAVLKWGETELTRRMEEREPNILSHTAHSVTRKGVKKRDLSDVELREILSELLPLVRMDHVLPPNSDILTQAIRRGLVSTPPSHMIGDERENLRVNAWIRGGKNQGLFVRPRLFMPYYEETKALLEDRMSPPQHLELMRLRRTRQHIPDIPDTLYMVSRINTAAGGVGGVGNGSNCGMDAISVAAAIPPPDNQTLNSMLKRENKLRQSPMCQRALLLPLSSKQEINRQIRLRVVREFNLPDPVAELLENQSHQIPAHVDQENHSKSMTVQTSSASNPQHMDDVMGLSDIDVDVDDDDEQTPPPSPAMAGVGSKSASVQSISPCYSSSRNSNKTFPRQQNHHQLGVHGSYGRLNISGLGLGGGAGACGGLPALITEGDYGRYSGPGTSGGLLGSASGSCSQDLGGHLSDMMPDVAMATASLGQLHLATADIPPGVLHGAHGVGQMPDNSLQLDLGDGPSHIMGAVGGPIGLRGIQHQLPPSNYHHYLPRSDSPFDLHNHNNHQRTNQPSPGPQAAAAQAQGSYNTGPPRYL